MPIRFNIHNEDLQFNDYMFNINIYIINEEDEEDEEDEEIKNINIKSELYNTIDKTLQIEDCPICYEKFNDNSNVTILCCNHIFHSECIKKWGEINNICPLCRKQIPLNI
jgi:hypothetical protein